MQKVLTLFKYVYANNNIFKQTYTFAGDFTIGIVNMNKQKLISLAIALSTLVPAMAGGILTNTNQSVEFLRNPARDAAIGLDGVYSNPAGVVFMPKGFHIAANWQMARQTRTVTTTNPLLALGKKNEGLSTKTYEGNAEALCIPSLQAAYNTDKWSIQFNFAIPSGGGICVFDEGLGSFESAVGMIANQLEPLGAKGYDCNAFMRGRQYFFGFTLGAAYKITDNWSVYGGLRALYGDASYKARINNIQVKMMNQQTNDTYYVDFDQFLNDAMGNINQQVGQAKLANQLGVMSDEEYAAVQTQATGVLSQLEPLQKYSQGVNLMSIQTGFGIAPIIGVDYKINNFNFAAKYEFRTRMRMKNHSTLDKAVEIDAINKYQDGTNVDEDSPALLTVGAQWSVLPTIRINAGYHHYFDTHAQWYKDSQKKLHGGTNEYLAGAEWDANDKLTISAGGQITRYRLSDDYMNDMSFVVNSYSFGLGLSYQVSEHVKLTAAYFQTNYDNYDKVTQRDPDTNAVVVGDKFTRTNKVLGIGMQVDL
mgnify:CR=1 FL=1